MNILVTGGAGFIGSNLIDRLLKKGDNVVCIDNFDSYYDPTIKEGNISNARKHDNFTLVKGDIRDDSALHRCFSGKSIEIVVHLAAKAGVRVSLLHPELYYDVNVIGTLRLLESMRNHDVKNLVFGSSSSIYGDNRKIPFSESDPVDKPISPYAASKKAGELLCYTYHKLYDFNVFCLRFFTVYGPRQRPEMAIHQFVRKITDGETITLFGDGTSQRDYTFIDDIINGVINCFPRLHGYEIINLGESRTITLNKLIGLIEKYIEKKAIIDWQPMQLGDVKKTFADIKKAKNILKYDPKYPIEEGLRNFIGWFQKERDGRHPFGR